MPDSDAGCPLTARPHLAGITELGSRIKNRRNRPTTGMAVLILNARFPVAVFLVPAALGAVGADAPPSAKDAAASHTRIVVIQPGKTGDRRPVVALANPAGTKDAEQLGDTYQGILNRELTRQALLIAARDELGLLTRDEVLGDAIGEQAMDKTAPPVDLITVLHTVEGKLSPALIHRGEGASAETLLRRDLADSDLPVQDRRSPIEIAETGRAPSFPKC